MRWLASERAGDEAVFLVVIETQRVKSFLFASRLLRETRGASLLLDRLNRQGTRDLVRRWNGRKIYLGGGSGRVIFEDQAAAEGFVRDLTEEVGGIPA